MDKLISRKRGEQRLCILIVFLCVIPLSFWEVTFGDSIPIENITIRDVIIAIENQEVLLQDVRVDFTLDYQISNGKTSHGEFFEIWKDEKVLRTYTSVDGEIITPKTTMVFDGEKTTVARPKTNEPTWGEIQPGNRLQSYFTPRRLCWDYTRADNKMKRLKLSKLLSEGEFSAKREMFKENLCYVIEGMYKGEYGPGYYRFYIDPIRGFSVLKLEYGSSSDKIVSIYDEVTLQEVSSNIWFPMQTTWRVFNPHPRSGSVAKFNVTKIEVNQSISYDVFKIQWKSGDFIYDSIARIQYQIP